MVYDWAVNPIKEKRAIAWANQQEALTKVKPNEKDIKAKYVSYAGLVVEPPKTVEEVVKEKQEEVAIEKTKNVKRNRISM